LNDSFWIDNRKVRLYFLVQKTRQDSLITYNAGSNLPHIVGIRDCLSSHNNRSIGKVLENRMKPIHRRQQFDGASPMVTPSLFRRNTMTRLKKSFALWLPGILAFLVIGAIQGMADPVALTADLTGATTGKFGQGTSSGTVSASGTSISLSGTTINFTAGAINITGLTAANNFSNVTLGTFSVAGNAGTTSFDGATFTLNVSFTVPPDLAPGGGTFTGTLKGTFNTGTSGTSVVWGAPQTLTFNSPSLGTYTLTIELSTPISPANNTSSDIRGVITFTPKPPAAVPEPTTIALLGSGIAGLAMRLRRRKSA
jgi:PEP-CTERM motif